MDINLRNINKDLKSNGYPTIKEVGHTNDWTIYRSIKTVKDIRFFFIMSINKINGELYSEIEVHKIFDEKVKIRERNYKIIPYEVIIGVETELFESIVEMEKYLLQKLDKARQ